MTPDQPLPGRRRATSQQSIKADKMGAMFLLGTLLLLPGVGLWLFHEDRAVGFLIFGGPAAAAYLVAVAFAFTPAHRFRGNVTHERGE